MQEESIGDLVRRMESDYIQGNVKISDYVSFDMNFTINKIEAYLNSIHVKGKYDSKGREKPFPNIVIGASNIWYRATDIDRKDCRIKATKGKDTVDAFLATIHIQNWMTKEKFGQFLNEWGRVLARYGSAVSKFVEQDGKLYISVIPWNRLIVDQIDFDSNPRIEVLELTEAQLKKRKGYDKEIVKNLLDARSTRETIRGNKKDNKADYIKLYEIHGELPLSYLTNNDKDDDTYVQQMHVITYVKGKERGTYDDFTLYSGKESKDPYMISHLIKEDGRTLAIGAVEHLFQSQWMRNHTEKQIKDQLDLAGKLAFQTSDTTFVGQNAIQAFETGDILIHAPNQPLTQLQNNSHDISALQSQAQMWKSLGNEITGISEAMLGVTPKAGTPWKLQEGLLQESYSLFEIMTENKLSDVENMFRERIIPHIKKKMDTSEEVSATLELHDIEWVDSRYIKNYSIKESNRIIKDKVLNGEVVTQEEQAVMIEQMQGGMKRALSEQGNQRFFKPDEISTKTWKEQFKDLEWELEFDGRGENKDYQGALATLNTALEVVMNPNYQNSPEAKMIVSMILQNAGYLSPLQLSQIRQAPPPTIAPEQVGVPPPGGANVNALVAK